MKNRLAVNIIRTFSTQIGCQFIAILSGIVIARMIGPEGKGFSGYAATAVNFVSVFFYGFADAVLYQFGKQKFGARGVHATALRIMFVALAFVVPAFVITAIVVPSQRPLAIAAIAFPFAIYTQIMTPFLLVRDKIALTNVRAVVQAFGTALFTVPLLVFAHGGLTAVLVVWVVFYAVTAAQSAWGMRDILAEPQQEVTGSPSELMRGQLKFGLRAAGGSAAGFLNLRIAVIVVSIMFSQKALGQYMLAIASGELLWQVSRAFVWPALGRIGSDSTADAAALVARLTRNILAIVTVLGVIAFAIGPWLIVRVYGAPYEPAGAALRWVLPGLVAYSAEIALTQFIVLQLARPVAVIWVQSISAVCCGLLTVGLASRFGIVAAAAATSFTFLIVTAVLTSLFVRGSGISAMRVIFIQREDIAHYTGALNATLRILRLRSA